MWPAIQSFRLRDAIDILLVALVLYRVFVMFKETRAVQMMLGLGALMAGSFLAHRFELYGTSWILDNFWSFWVIALVVLFQPELRRVLASLGQGRVGQALLGASREERAQVTDEIANAVESLSGRRIGALLVIERATGLRQYAELGVPLDAQVSADLLVSVFLPYSPLHDGAVFLQGTRIAAAGCFLPLSRNLEVGRALGTRHRAALGITEETDAVAIVVSEETGRVSLAVEGEMDSPVEVGSLRARLLTLVGEESPAPAGRASVWLVLRRLLPLSGKHA